jgi:hypothetical protein
MANPAVTIPQPNVPFLNPDGSIARPWLYFMVGVQSALGGTTPIPVPQLQAQIDALAVEEALNAPVTPQPRPALSIADVMSERPQSSAPALLSFLPVDSAPRQPINPFLAALLV